MRNLLVLASVLHLSISASAAQFKPEDLLTSSKTSLDHFLTNNPDQGEFITGFKTWKSADEAKVKIYITHNGGHSVEVNYSCSKDAQQKVNCTEI